MALTAKQVFKNILIELHKINAPALKLYEFNYYANKATSQYLNTIYNFYNTNQQTTDDLRALHSTVYLEPEEIIKNISDQKKIYTGTYECWLPLDYVHLLNCICTFTKANTDEDCGNDPQYIYKAASRLTSDMVPLVIDDYYNKPSVERPYYMIFNHNMSEKDAFPTDPLRNNNELINDSKGTDPTSSNKSPKVISLNGKNTNIAIPIAQSRISNPVRPRLEIRCGDNNKYKLTTVQVDYIKAPQLIHLTQSQLDETIDNSQILEWSDYVCQEIINILLRLLLERDNPNRLAVNTQINQTIGRQTGQ